jgi:hypothetical protein
VSSGLGAIALTSTCASVGLHDGVLAADGVASLGVCDGAHRVHLLPALCRENGEVHAAPDAMAFLACGEHDVGPGANELPSTTD